MHFMLYQCCLHFLGHVHHMDNGCITKMTCRENWFQDIPFPQQDICKLDIKLTDINQNSWELMAADHNYWCHTVKTREEKGGHQLVDKQ